MRVWIETQLHQFIKSRYIVTLRVRVWIETLTWHFSMIRTMVTLRVRVWIETNQHPTNVAFAQRHPPREGVD